MKKEEKKIKFDFEKMKAEAMNSNPETRKNAFKDYFERFEEFPSYLFDNSAGVDALLSQTIRDLQSEPDITTAMRKGIEQLMGRLVGHERVPAA